MKLFTVGPVQMYEHTLNVRSKQIPYFRTPEFSSVMLENSALLKKVMGAEDNTEVVYLTASGSGAMEATVINCFNEKDKLLIISGGTFGQRFEKICEINKIPFEALKLNQEEKLKKEHFIKYENQNFTGLLVNLHETFTGQLYDINIIHDFCKRNNMYLVVDAISTFLCDEYNMKKYDIDVSIISSQKGLCLAPGLSMVALSDKIINEKILKNDTKSLYFDFKDCIINIKRGQTPFTPAVGICFELNDMLKYIDKQGVDSRIKEVKDKADYFREKIKELPVSLPEFTLSNCITPIIFEDNISMALFDYLKDEKDIMPLHPIVGELGKKSIRIAHIGNLNFKDYDLLLEGIKNFLKSK